MPIVGDGEESTPLIGDSTVDEVEYSSSSAATSASPASSTVSRSCTSYYTLKALTRTNAELVKRQIAAQRAVVDQEEAWVAAGGEIDLEQTLGAPRCTEHVSERRATGDHPSGTFSELDLDADVNSRLLGADDDVLALPASTAPLVKTSGDNTLRKVLTVWDLLAYGISSTLGAGVRIRCSLLISLFLVWFWCVWEVMCVYVCACARALLLVFLHYVCMLLGSEALVVCVLFVVLC
jgi:hypothetical protein